MLKFRSNVAPREAPKNLGQHREAVKALFRALLQGVRDAPGINPTQSYELQNVVRNRFKRNKHETSLRRLRFNFSAAYEAIDILDGARAGIVKHQARIVDLLNMTSAEARAPPPVFLPLHLRREKEKYEKELVKAQAPDRPPKRSILDRPLPLQQLSGRRHVPRLFNAGGLPILRISKPISPALSAMINHRLETKQKRWESLDRFSAEMDVAGQEDVWDGMMNAELGSTASQQNEPSWCTASYEARKGVLKLLDLQRTRNTIRARDLQAIVDKEQALFGKERLQRRRKRTGERQEQASTRFT